MSESTLHAVISLLHEVVDDDLVGIEVGRDTSFSDDLELESIEFVALAEAVQAHWGSRVDFTSWLASKSLDEVITLTVGDLVDHVDACLSST